MESGVSDYLFVAVGQLGLMGLLISFYVKKFAKCFAEIEDLHKWHDVTDEDGVRLWYVRQSLEKSLVRLDTTMDKLSETVAAQSRASVQMAGSMERMITIIERMETFDRRSAVSGAEK